ncbi:MAG: hypothetical protein KGO82_17550 [Bacteroidota bacterium]|nr:hypothetical protein [Bacteroidota bacterium]
MAQRQQQAVLTADIVDSTRLSAPLARKLIRALQRLLQGTVYEFYRGDSFQVFLSDATQALRLLMQCRAIAIATAETDIRMSIGIGKASKPTGRPGMAKDPAFVLSGRTFDRMVRSNARLAIGCSQPLAAEGFQVIAAWGNSIFDQMTAKQAAVILELLSGRSQQDTARQLRKSKSTVHQHATAGNWPAIEVLLMHYTNLINLMS